MRPIETEYRSITFRSRTEARWAVFFDVMEWRWEYEPVEVPFGNSVYIPDFRINCNIRGKDFVAEVKPISFWELTRFEIEKAWAAVEFLGCPILMLAGEISQGPFWFLSFNKDSQRQEDEVLIGNSRAIKAAKLHRFDGYDNDRAVIQQRYLRS